MSGLTSQSLSAMEAQSMAQYINTFLDLVDNMPNEISRHVTQLHQLNNAYLVLINKMHANLEKFNSPRTPTADKTRIGKRVEALLIQMQELADEKMRYAQVIVDLIETKGKELDADYEEILFVNELALSNSAANTNNCGKSGAKPTTNGTKTSSQQSNPVTSLTEEYKSATNGDKAYDSGANNGSKSNDKRLLPRRACAIKPGETNEPSVTPKLSKRPKSCQRKYSPKSPNFQLTMSKIYRDMARRRAKLPINKQKSLAFKRKANRKSVPNYKNRSIVGSLKAKNMNSAQHYSRAKPNPTKKSLSSSSSSSSTSSQSSSSSSTLSSSSSSSSRSSTDMTRKHSKTVLLKSNQSSLQSSVKRERKRTSNNGQTVISTAITNNNSNKSSAKKSRIQNENKSPSNESMFVGEPVDPNEPTYCLCAQVSYGEMICCDNESCAIEWFHFPCVDLVHKPKGKWFCPNCRGDRSNVPKK